MPRISSLATAASTLQAACDLVGEANGLNSLSLSRMKSSYSGFGEGVCTCARCMRRAGPIREDVENKLVQITYALAAVYDDSPDLDLRVTDDHRARAEEMMGCVEAGDVTRLREIFLEIEDWEAEGVLEPGTAPEIATYLIISAAQVGQPEIIRLLSEWDADMEETDSIRRGRPLMHAANNGHTSAVKALVECGADPEATDDNGYTALMVAVFSDRSSAAEALLEGGAHVDTPDRAGRTALSYAAMYGSTDCIYLLAGRGADVAHIDADGNTPLELAEGSGRQSAVDALKKLQLRVKMQEKRKVKQSRTRGGCAELDAAELRAKEQEAARAAAELLEQLEKEEAAKAAAARAAAAGSASAKKKKKGKGKAGGHEHDADSVQDSSADAVPPAQDHKGHQQQEQQQAQAQQTPGKLAQQQHRQQQLQHAGLSNGGSGWDPHEQRQGRDDASKLSADGSSSGHLHKQQQQQHGKEHQPLVSKGSGDHHHHHRDVSSPGYAVADHQLAPGTPGAASAAGGDGCGGSASGSVADEGGEALRREWEALLEAAARCKDATQQPQMLTRVSDMLPRCADAGISVKYGRKVLQRLQAVGPARKALTAALASKSPGMSELEEALGAAKVCRCLLEDDLLQRAESKLSVLQKQHEQQLRLQQKRLAEEQQQQQQRLKQQQEEEARRLQQQREAEERRLQLEQREREWLQRQQELEAQRKQQQEQEQLLKQQQERELLQQQRQREEQERQQQLQKQQELQQQRQREEQERLAQEQAAAQQRSWQQQQQQQRLQADQAGIAAAAAAGVSDPMSPRPPARQLSGASSAAAAAAAVGPADPELLPQQLPSRQQQLQQLQLQQQQLQLQQQQQQPLSPHGPPPLSAQQLPQSRLSMLGAQQQQPQQQQQLVSSLQQAALQGLQGASSALLSQQQQQERQLAMQLLEQAAAAQTALSSAMPVKPLLQDPQQQHQQQQAAALSQLQLLHQQRLFAAQLQGHAGGALQGGPGLRQPGSLLGAGGSGGLLGGGVQQGLGQSSQGLSQAQLQLQRQQQQQLASSYWASGAGDALLSPGGVGSVGQPLPGRLSAEILPPGPPAVTMGLASGPGLHDLARSGSLGPVGGPGPVGPRGGLRGSNLGGGALGGLGPGVLGGGATGGVVGGAVNPHTGLPAEADMLDDHLHPAFSMAHALLDDDEQNAMVLECSLCGEGRANTCCLPCGCLCMCASCAGRWRQQDLTGLCPFCMRGLEDFAVVS